MNTTTGTTFTIPDLPTAYQPVGFCKCGAPTFIDADLPRTDKGHFTQVPVTYYSCTCRFNLTGWFQTIPSPVVPVWPLSPSTDPLLPPITWTAVPTDFVKQFLGSGGVSQDPNIKYTVLNKAE